MTLAQPTSTLHPGAKQDGFAVRNVTPLKNLRATAYELEHLPSGARVLHVHAADHENLFAIAFRTPPADDTGLPHILEHAVLGGSKKYPVKDPFVELVKMSMATFINAMTYNDKTVYPVASNVREDFYNLAEVYCDAVFHPNLTEDTFKQEGCHLEFSERDNPKSELLVKGIVFNEMKGAYSSADALVDRESFQKLFPETPYGKDSGGDPEHIPELTYAQFKRFYQERYHPGNAFIFLYGDIPTADHLAFLKARLAGFKRRTVRSEIPRQPRWTQPREQSQSYPIARDETPQNKTFLTLNWIVGEGTDAQDVMAFHALERILLGHQGAPLRKALVDSKLGQDLTDSGFAGGQRESTFHVGLKGSEVERKEAFQQLVFDTLRQTAAEGFSREQVEAAFQQLAYRYLEIAELFPLRLMEGAYATWLYGADPLIFLRADEHLEELKRRYKADPEIFGRLIQERLLDNPHRITLTFTPDPDLQSRKDAAFAEAMRKRKAGLKKKDRERLVKEARELERRQSAPNPPEALARLPQLKVSALPPRPREIATRVERLDGGVELLRNDVFANGVNYLHLDINLAGLPEELFRCLPLYGDGVTKMGAAGLDYVKMAERVAAHTGGVGFWTSVSAHAADEKRCLRSARFSLKALDGRMGPALNVLRDLLFEPDFSDAARLKDVLVQARAAHRSALVSNGLGLALRHAGRGLNREGRLLELIGGLPQTRLIEQWVEHYGEQRERIVSQLEKIRAFLLNRKRLNASFTGSDAAYEKVKKRLAEWCGKMRAEPVRDQLAAFRPWEAPPREGLAAPMEVAFCAQALPAPHLSHPDAPLLSVASRLLSLGYLWEEVRIKGGAYGGGCGYNGVERQWNFYSYCDPWVKKTLDHFKRLIEHVRQADWSQSDIDRAIIGTAKQGEKPIRPAEATGAALWRRLHGDTPERRAARHAAILKATPASVKRAVLELLEKHFGQGGVCVVSSRKKLEQANREMSGAALAIEDIMK